MEAVALVGTGVLAGLGVAMPLGAIGTLLLRVGLADGFRAAAAGATGVAVVDAAYCALALAVGSLVAPLLQAHQGPLLTVSGLLLVGLGLRQLAQARRARAARPPGGAAHGTTRGPARDRTPLAAFVTFVCLTALNPMTLAYFLAMAGGVTLGAGSWRAATAFVAAVGLASWAWQLVLAGTGAVLGRSLGPRATEAVGLVASAVVVALGCSVAAGGLLA